MTQARSRWTWRSFMPVVVPALIGLGVWLLGHQVRAMVLWAIALAMLLPVLAGLPVDRYLTRFGMLVAHWVGVAATGVVGVLLVAVGAVARLVGSDPLTPRRARLTGWQPAPTSTSAERLAASPFGIEPGGQDSGTTGGVRTFLRAGIIAFGTVAAIMVLDLGVGLTWEAVKGEGGPVGQVVDAINLSGSQTTRHDIRADLPAMAAYPWADAYFRETQQTPSAYWPFTESRPLPFKGKYVNVEGWSRRSYEPRNLPDGAPVVWMFGGSTTWGEGQRDDYTIASDISRIAARAGTPVRIMNYGQRGWTHFQEMILFEQLLASQPKPDLVLFYDGANEINAQSLGAKDVPTHTLADQYAERLAGSSITQQFGSKGGSEPSALQTIWDEYALHSALRKVIGKIGDLVSPPAGAAPSRPAASDDDKPAGAGTYYSKTIDDARNAVDVYERGRRMTEHLAADHGVDAVFFWQPVMVGPTEKWANAHITPPTVNISDALADHQDVFIDGGHTNEVGAQIVAERIWKEIGSRVRRFSKSRPTADSAPVPSTTAPASTTAPPTSVRESSPEPDGSIASAITSLAGAANSACTLERWKSTVANLRAGNDTEREAVGDLAQRYLRLVAAWAPKELAAQAAVVSAAADSFPDLVVRAELDPAQPVLPQLLVIRDPAGPFRVAFDAISAAAFDSCGR